MRKAISKKLRFEVFKRDGFTCQYCGRKAPDVLLQADHVQPQSKGGSTDILNLITSCGECNLGKGARELSDDSVLAKQHQQLAELNEKRQQLKMMLSWRNELKGIESDKLAEVVRLKEACMPGWHVNDHGKAQLEAMIRDFPLDIILDSIDVAKSKIVMDGAGKATDESVSEFSSYIGRVANCKLRDRKEPGIGELMRLRGYMRSFMDFREWECLDLLRQAKRAGIGVDELRSLANSCKWWGRFRDTIYEAIADHA